MLVLTRKLGERVMIGPDVEIAVVQVRSNSVRLGVTAPCEIPVHRAEVRRRMQENDSGQLSDSVIPGEAEDAQIAQIHEPLPNGVIIDE
ncbi:MAG: carbon storage regulator CsrA [Deltaproteobacteria bacterium]